MNNLLKVLANLPRHGTCELMCHPGEVDSSKKYEHWEYGWSEELDALTHAETREFIRRLNIELVTYKDH